MAGTSNDGCLDEKKCGARLKTYIPDGVLCKILEQLPFSKHKISLVAVSKQWMNALCLPSSHATEPEQYLAFLDQQVTLTSRILKVLPCVTATSLHRRLQAGGLHHVQTLWDVPLRALADHLPLPNLTNVYLQRTVHREFQDPEFCTPRWLPQLRKLRIEGYQASALKSFMQYGLIGFSHLQELNLDKEHGGCYPLVHLPPGCVLTLSIYSYTGDILGAEALVPLPTAQSLSSLDVKVVMNSNNFVDWGYQPVNLTIFSECRVLQAITFHISASCSPSKGIVVFGFANLPKSVHWVCVYCDPCTMLQVDVSTTHWRLLPPSEAPPGVKGVLVRRIF